LLRYWWAQRASIPWPLD